MIIFIIMSIAVMVGVEVRSRRRAKGMKWKALAAEMAAGNRAATIAGLGILWALVLAG